MVWKGTAMMTSLGCSKPGPECLTCEKGRVWHTLGEVGDRGGGSKIEVIRDKSSATTSAVNFLLSMLAMPMEEGAR